MKYNKGGDGLRIKTVSGDLQAIVGYDNNYPEIYIVLTTPEKVEFTLAVIGQDGKIIRTRIKEELLCEDFTYRIDFSPEIISEAVHEVIDM